MRIRAVFLRDPGRLAAASFTTSRTQRAAGRRSRLLPRAGLPPPVVVVPLGAACRSVLSAAMRPTAGPREGEGADLRVRGGAPLVEPKTRTAEALLPGVVAGLHTRTARPNPPAPLCPARSRQDCRGGGASSSTPGLVTAHGSAAPRNPRNSGFFPVVASRDSLHCSFSGGSLDSPPRHIPGKTPPESFDARDSCSDTDAAP
jgi:hypothetical protein